MLYILSMSNPVTPSPYHNLCHVTVLLLGSFMIFVSAATQCSPPRSWFKGYGRWCNKMQQPPGNNQWKTRMHFALWSSNHIMSQTIAAKWANGAIVRNDGLLANNLGLCQMSWPLRSLQQPRKLTHFFRQFSKPKMCWSGTTKGKLGLWPHYLRS